MVDRPLPFESNLFDLTPNAWLGRIDDLCDQFGFFEQLGAQHCAGFLEAGNNLIVTFENAEDVRAHNARAEPRGFEHARYDGWSHLSIMSFTQSWFRDSAIFDFFDRMVDDGFFEDFETIVFYGAGAGGYAAAAYCVAAPGATVLALSPQATLARQLAGWDWRFIQQRRNDFCGRYGFAPDMIEGAGQVFVAYDPHVHLDAMHAALFYKPHVTMMPCPLLGTRIDHAFDRLGIHDVLLRLAMDGSLDAKRFRQLLRARRYDDSYAQSLITHLTDTGHRDMAKAICRYKEQRSKNPYYTDVLAALSGD